MSRSRSSPKPSPLPATLRALWVAWGLAACSQRAVLDVRKTVDSGLATAAEESPSEETEPDPSSSGEVIEQGPVQDDAGDGHAGSGAGSGAAPVYTGSAWTGECTYTIDKTSPLDADCAGDTVAEGGVRLETGLDAWQELCRIGSDVYEDSDAASEACDGAVDLARSKVHGFALRGSDLEIWRIRQDGTKIGVELQLHDAPYDAGRADFSFDDSWNGEGTVTVTGFVQLNEATET